MVDKKREYYKKFKDYLIGRKIEHVFYTELNCYGGIENWKYSANIHSIDMQIVFKLDNNDLIELIWDNEFYCYGIGIRKISRLKKVQDLKTIDVTKNRKWSKLLKKKILQIKVFWDLENSILQKIERNGIVKSTNFVVELPQTIEINFETNDKIWISALEISKSPEASYWQDHLTILFNEKDETKFELIKRASSSHIIQ